MGDFWKEVRCLSQHHKNSSNLPTVDGITGDQNISDMWASKLEILLNSGNGHDHDCLLEVLYSSSFCSSDLDIVSISSNTILTALSHLKLGKSDGSGLSSDHWVHAAPAIAGLLASLFTLARLLA